MILSQLIEQIKRVDSATRSEAAKAVNRRLTLRNWLVGSHLIHYEQQGEDRAVYGVRLLENIALHLKNSHVKGMTAPELSRYRQFFQTYPNLAELTAALLPTVEEILGTTSQKSDTTILLTIPGTPSQESSRDSLPPLTLINKLSFSHFVEIIKIKDPLKRLFYEVECIGPLCYRRHGSKSLC